MPSPINIGSTGHKYVGTIDNQDIYELTDAGGNVIQWRVAIGDDSRNVIEGTVQNLGDASTYTAKAAVAHFVGTQDGQDIYQLTDAGGNLIQWRVAARDDYRNVIAGSIQNLGATTNAGTSTVTAPSTGTNTNQPGPNPQKPAAEDYASGLAPAAKTATPGARIVGDVRHRYKGTLNGEDIYETTDESGNQIEWHVRQGDDSRNPIPGSIRNLGATQATGTLAGDLIAKSVQPGSGSAVPTASSTTTAAAAGSSTPNGVPGSVQINNSASYIPGKPTSNTPVKWQSDSTTDYYELLDEGGNVIRWQTAKGDDPRAVLPGTLFNFTQMLGNSGFRGSGQIVDSGTNLPPVPNKPAPDSSSLQTITGSGSTAKTSTIPAATTSAQEKSTVVVFAGLAAAVLNAFK